MKRTATFRRLKEVLTNRRNALRRVLHHELNGLRNGVGLDTGDSVDNAVDDEFDLVSSQLVQSESRELGQIEEALKRMAQGRYGLCDSCGEVIPAARLQALPYAQRCVKCQRTSEGRGNSMESPVDWSSVRDELDDEPYNSIADHVIDVH